MTADRWWTRHRTAHAPQVSTYRFSGAWGFIRVPTSDGRMLTGHPEKWEARPRSAENWAYTYVPEPVPVRAFQGGALTEVGSSAVVWASDRTLLAEGVVRLPGTAVPHAWLQADMEILETQSAPAEFAFGARLEITRWRLKSFVLGSSPAWRRLHPVRFERLT